MPVAKADAPAPAYVGMISLPIPIPFIPGGQATATYDLIRVLDISARWDAVMAAFIDTEAQQEAEAAAISALPDADAAAPRRAALETAVEANRAAGYLYVLEYTRCQLDGINPTPVPGRAETWAHIHPALCKWLAQQGRAAAEAQLTSPLSALTGLRSAPR